MAVLVSDLIAKVRIQSGLRNNRLFSDDVIAGLLDDAWKEEYDVFVESFAHWTSKTFPFSITGSTPDTARLNLVTDVPDLQMVQGVNWVQGNVRTPLLELGSFAERNQSGGGAYGIFGGIGGRRYFPNGDYLELYPSQSAQGDYELVYTPQAETLALPVTVSFDIGDSATTAGAGDGDPLKFSFPEATFTSDMVGGTITVAFSAGPPDNTVFNGTYDIVSILSPTLVVTSGTMGSTPLTDPSAGTITITYQTAGTRSTLPIAFGPWALFLTTHASIAVRTSRQQNTTELERKLVVEHARIAAMSKQRAEGVTQAPWVRRGRIGGYFG